MASSTLAVPEQDIAISPMSPALLAQVEQFTTEHKQKLDRMHKLQLAQSEHTLSRPHAIAGTPMVDSPLINSPSFKRELTKFDAFHSHQFRRLELCAAALEKKKQENQSPVLIANEYGSPIVFTPEVKQTAVSTALSLEIETLPFVSSPLQSFNLIGATASTQQSTMPTATSMATAENVRNVAMAPQRRSSLRAFAP